MQNIKAVLLDIDGTLLLSNDAHARAFEQAATRLGIPADFQTIRSLIGKGGDKLLPEAFGVSAESELGKRLEVMKGQIFKTLLAEVQPTPGCRALLTRFRREGMKLVVATSAEASEVQSLLKKAGVQDLIEDQASSDDVESSKPDPDVVVAALRKTGETADTVCMLGDTPYDVEAARRAGVNIIAVRCGGWRDADLTGSLAVFDDPADVLRHFEELFGLP
jgi:HAD superfamily hydrolase (TIGR01509 family)